MNEEPLELIGGAEGPVRRKYSTLHYPEIVYHLLRALHIEVYLVVSLEGTAIAKGLCVTLLVDVLYLTERALK